ncbi:hypothetical protein [Actinacidiphila acidipaludis]|uniref:PE-PGRS family protein n=1 Tax=Actinacidiphila acidipaludis TaxID=2873382 RepID=A0ABS7Q8S4_9ACTN|nr:hypothetical protein [Streptomyces acidipaludis]MBY8878835.1 hypothetical protein [Streptomyces acidipaludis]
MKKNRMVVGAVLTAGLGLSGVVAASSSGAATPAPTASTASTAGASSATAQLPAQNGKPASGPIVVCAFVRDPAGVRPGKPGKAARPAKPGAPGTALPFPAPGEGLPLPKPGGKPARITVEVAGGKVYVNGKEVKGAKLNKGCPKPPALPPAGKGKGGRVVIVTRGTGGTGARTVRVPGVPGLPGGKDAGGVSVRGVPGGAEAGLTTGTLPG